MVLYVALVMVVAMMLLGVSMLRSVGNGGNVGSNLSFKQNATLAAERGVEQALQYLTTSAASTLEADDTGHGYYATWGNNFDPIAFNWTGAPQATADDGSGNRVRWVMHRLCSTVGSASPSGTQVCSRYGEASGVGGGPVTTGVAQRILYRVTSRVDGPRNTVSYVQIVVY